MSEGGKYPPDSRENAGTSERIRCEHSDIDDDDNYDDDGSTGEKIVAPPFTVDMTEMTPALSYVADPRCPSTKL